MDFHHGLIGRRDVAMLVGSERVAVGEAVRVLSFDDGDLSEHVRRVFSYSSSGAHMFAFLWCYVANPKQLWERYLADVAPRRAPEKFEFVRWTSPSTGPNNHVWHATAEYCHPDSTTCQLTHVMVDFRQEARRSVNRPQTSEQ